MSQLDKLAIRGIRSFDHQELSVIQFYNPLTVIVGHNGSGKTTIIECLKYATTGDLPPNTKGGAFVHDPSIAGINEVRAQVKLRFINARKERMLVERRLQVTKKKLTAAGGGAGLTMKTLEGVISFADESVGKDSKKRTSLSTKCASLDEEVPKQLGVSKAILENVIFCHQEESNWPLSEPAALKKKFDDIFEATKYTKALDQIKSLRKEKGIEIKVDKEKLAALKTDRDRAVKLRLAIDKLSDSTTAKQVDHADLDERIQTLSSENKSFFDQASKYQDIVSKAETIETQRTLVEENLGQVRANLTELSDSDAELKAKIETHTQTLDASKALATTSRRQLQDEEDDLDSSERKRSHAQTAHGQALATQQRYWDNVARRRELVREIAGRHGLSGWDHELSEGEVGQFEERLGELMNEQARKIQVLKAEALEADNERQKEISNHKIARASDQRSKLNIADQITAQGKRISDLNRKLDSTSTSVADVTYAESSLAEDVHRKADLEASIKASNFPEQLRVKQGEQKELEERREALHLELTGLNLQADVRAKLGLKKTERKRKDEAIQSLLDKSAATFRRYTKVEPLRDNMEPEVNAVIKSHEAEINAAERSQRDANRELSSIETSVNLTKSKLKELKDSGDRAKKQLEDKLRLLQVDANTSLEAAVREAEEEMAILRDEVENLQGATKFYDLLLSRGKKEKVCLGCDRHLDAKELAAFERHVAKQKERAPTKLKESQQDLKSWEDQVADLRKLLPLDATCSKLLNEDIPAAEKAAEAYVNKLPAATSKAQEAAQKVTELKAQLQEVQLLKKSASDVTRMHRETEDIARDIAKLESELLASGSTATSEDIQDELTKLGDKLRAVTQTMEKLRSESTKQTNALHALGNSIHQGELKLSNIKQELKDKEMLEKQKESAQTEVQKLELQVRDLDKKIRDSEAPLRKLQDEATEARRQQVEAESVATRELAGYNKSAEQLDVNAKEIKSYTTRGGDAQLAKCEAELKQHEKVVAEKKKAIAALQVKISKVEKSVSDAASVLRNYQDNVQLREGRRKIKKYDEEIAALDVDSAKKAYRTFETEYNERRQKQVNLQSHQAKLGGEIEMMKKDLEDKISELKTEYDNIDEKYKIELIKVKVTEAANLDLEKYGKALDSAIMSFHGAKMTEINETIADLWTKTYQGTDIDKIMIKSDAEGKSGGRSYNYRVVMQKDNTEMDMRGRCSAGQKVLASIIIRLALAESFGTNCGIMALDEPTTNLDHDNIDALARALSELIKERRGQSNFQLVVITHDEGFLETLGGTGVLDKYWRVSRGDGGQVSSITKEQLS